MSSLAPIGVIGMFNILLFEKLQNAHFKFNDSYIEYKFLHDKKTAIVQRSLIENVEVKEDFITIFLNDGRKNIINLDKLENSEKANVKDFFKSDI